MRKTRRQFFSSKDLEKRFGKLTVGQFLHTWRTSEEMTLQVFGKRIGLSVANLCDVEKGRKGISPAKAEKIAEAIGVPPTLLIRLAIEESLRAAGLRYDVDVKPT